MRSKSSWKHGFAVLWNGPAIRQTVPNFKDTKVSEHTIRMCYCICPVQKT